MIIIVAVTVLLLSFIIGTASYIVIPRYEERKENIEAEGSTASVTTAIRSFLNAGNRKQICFLAVLSLLCAAVAALSFSKDRAPLDFCRQICTMLALMSAMIIDKKTHRIPNAVILTALGAGAALLLLELVFSSGNFKSELFSSFFGMICCVVFFYIIARLTKEGIGMGDVKLIAVTAWLLGLAPTVTVVLVSMILCSVAAIILVIAKKKNKSDRIAFGPFMFFGYILTLILFSL